MNIKLLVLTLTVTQIIQQEMMCFLFEKGVIPEYLCMFKTKIIILFNILHTLILFWNAGTSGTGRNFVSVCFWFLGGWGSPQSLNSESV